MHRPSLALCGLASLVAASVCAIVLVVIGAVAAGGAVAAAPAATVRTVLGPSVLDGPGGLALDAAGNLFVADTGHCRVLVVPARSGVLDGRRVRAGRTATFAGSTCSGGESIGHPTGVAVDPHGDVFIAEATAQRVQEVRAGSRTPVTVAGTGSAGFNGDGLAGTASTLDQPTGVAVDAAGDLFIADTANCRIRVLPAGTATLFGQAMTAGHLFTVAGTGVCGSDGQGGPLRTVQLWNPVAVALDSAGDLLVADSGDQSVLLAPARAAGSFYGTAVGTGDMGVVVGGSGGYQPYLADGLPAVGQTAELNDPRGLAVGPTGALVVSDGIMRVIRVVPAVNGTLLGRVMQAGNLYTAAGALPVSSAEGSGDGTRWIVTSMRIPVGVAVSVSGAVYYSDAASSTVRVLSPPARSGSP